MRRLPVVASILALCATSCASRRLLRVENEVLRQHATDLERRVADLEKRLPNPDDYTRDVDLSTVHAYLDRASYDHVWNRDGNGYVRMEYAGHNAHFSVTIQHFASVDVLFMATDDYLALRDAQSIESVVLLLVQLAALNYDLLLGKFQLNPETGAILLSTELHVADGLGFHTFIASVDHLCQTADLRHPDLKRAIEGLGI